MDEDNWLHKAMTDPPPSSPADRVRATLTPRPEPHYSAPWRVAGAVAEGGALIVDANNQTVCRTMVPQAAEAIVLAVNTFAGVA